MFLSAVVGTVAGAVFNDAFGQSMSIAGQLDVSPAGSADYRIPIGVPPGTGGMVPALALEYSSHGANGVLGVGWTLSGLPSIARCPETVAQDGRDGRVDYTANDRFCMQGQRLIAISGGGYGADGTEYRTEIDGFTKIVSRGAAGNGPAWFEIKTKSGQTLEIGNTADSRILAQGKTTARAWTVNKISDTKGNYLTVSYLVDAPNGQVYPDRVDYTGNAAAGLVPYNSVRFVYEANDPRTDVPLIYHGGSLIKSVKRLSLIQTYAESVKVNEYRFSYGYSVATGYSLLNSIALCDGGNACLPATTMTYTGTNYITSPAVGGFTVDSNPGAMNDQLLNYESTFSDFNGDGLQDIFWERTDAYDRTNGKRELWLSNTTGGFQRITNLMGLDDVWGTGTGTSTFKSHVGDFNGDQKADILWVQLSTSTVTNGTAAGSLVLWTSNGDGTFVVGNLASPNVVATGYDARLGDFNSDGRTDIWWRNKSAKKRILWMNTGGAGGTFQVTTNVMGADGTFPAGTSTTCSFAGSANRHPDPWEFIYFLADLEGDGKDDVFWHHITTFHDNAVRKVCVNVRVGQWRKTMDGAATPFVLGALANRCTYDGTFPDGSNSDDVSTVCKYATAGLIPADFNGDGKDDIYWQALDWRVMWMSTGATPSTSSALNFTTTSTATPEGTFKIFLNLNGQNGQATYYTPMLFDFNADGKTDIMFSNPGNTSRFLWISKGDGSFIQLLNVANRNGVKPGTIAFVTDLNGDGKADVFWDTHDAYGRSTGKKRELWLSDGIPSDLLKTVTDGLGIVTTVSYEPLTKGGTVYARDANATYPLLDIQGPLYVVTRVDTGDGIGGTYSMSYSYAGGKADQAGRGFLGFRQRVKTDLRTDIVETSTYRQDFPYLSVLANEEKKLGAQLLNRTINTHSAVNLGGTRHFVGVSQSQTASWDLNGTAMPTTTTTYQYDAFGNPTQIVVTGSDNTVRTTTNTYDNDIINWYLGRLKRATVTNTVVP